MQARRLLLLLCGGLLWTGGCGSEGLQGPPADGLQPTPGETEQEVGFGLTTRSHGPLHVGALENPYGLVAFPYVYGNTITRVRSAPALFTADARIAFASWRDTLDTDIYVMNADGSGQKRLTTHFLADSEPAFSPDGSRIAFISTRDGNSEIYLMNADGSGQTRLTNHAATDLGPALQPGRQQDRVLLRSRREQL